MAKRKSKTLRVGQSITSGKANSSDSSPGRAASATARQGRGRGSAETPFARTSRTGGNAGRTARSNAKVARVAVPKGRRPKEASRARFPGGTTL